MKTRPLNGQRRPGRLPVLLRWLAEAEPDVVCLQELKAAHGQFPAAAIARRATARSGTGRRAGTAWPSSRAARTPIETRRGLPGDPDDMHSRYIEAAVDGVLVGCLYLPNGNPAPGPKFDYKLRWFERFDRACRGAAATGADRWCWPATTTSSRPSCDVYKPERWVDDALFRPETRARVPPPAGQGWTDALRTLHPDERIYTFWDYFRNAWARDAGLRIDHLLLSPVGRRRLVAAGVDRDVRGWEKASDHAPAWIELAGQAGYVCRLGRDVPRRRADLSGIGPHRRGVTKQSDSEFDASHVLPSLQ